MYVLLSAILFPVGSTLDYGPYTVECFYDILYLKAVESFGLLCEPIAITISDKVRHTQSPILSLLNRFDTLELNLDQLLS